MVMAELVKLPEALAVAEPAADPFWVMFTI
jgi:hypothetical protein